MIHSSSSSPFIRHRTIRCDEEGKKFFVSENGQPDKPLFAKRKVVPKSDESKTRNSTGKDLLWEKLKETSVGSDQSEHLRNLAVANVWDSLTDLERSFLSSQAGEKPDDQDDIKIDLRMYRREMINNTASNSSETSVDKAAADGSQNVVEAAKEETKIMESDSSVENTKGSSESVTESCTQVTLHNPIPPPSNNLSLVMDFIRRLLSAILPLRDAFQYIRQNTPTVSSFDDLISLWTLIRPPTPHVVPVVRRWDHPFLSQVQPDHFMVALEDIVRRWNLTMSPPPSIAPSVGRLDHPLGNYYIQPLLAQLEQMDSVRTYSNIFRQSATAIQNLLLGQERQRLAALPSLESEDPSTILVETKVPKNAYTFESPKVVVKKLPSGGVLRVFPGLLDEIMREKVCHEMNSLVKYRQYKINGGDEPRIHSLYHKEAVCAAETSEEDDLNDSAYGPTPGYSYAGIHMKSRPLTELPEISQLAEGLKSVSQVEEWNVGVNTLIYRDGNDRIGKHSDDDQGEEKIMTVIISSPPEPRRVLIEEKKMLPGSEGEQIELLLNAGDAYEMDAEMQKHYIHSVPKKAKDVGFGYQRAVIVLRSGKTDYVSSDSGRPMPCIAPPPKVDNYRFGPIPGLKTRDVFSRSDMLRLGFHGAHQRSVSGNCSYGCDSIIVSGARPDGLGDDQSGILLYAVEKRIGGTSLLVSAALHQRIRVFRLSATPFSLQINSDKEAGDSSKNPKCNLYTYGGLYRVIACTAPSCLAEAGTMIFILAMDNYDKELGVNVDPDVETYQSKVADLQQSQKESLHDFYSLAYIDCADSIPQFKLRTDKLQSMNENLPLETIVPPIAQGDPDDATAAESDESKCSGIDADGIELIESTLKDQLVGMFPPEELEAFRQELDARHEEQERKAREMKLLGKKISRKKKGSPSKKSHHKKVRRSGSVKTAKYGSASSFNLRLLQVLEMLDPIQGQEIIVRSAVKDARLRGSYCPALSRAFTNKGKVQQCLTCKVGKQGAHFCRIRHKHQQPDFDGDNSAQYVADCFLLPSDELKKQVENDEMLINQLFEYIQPKRKSDESIMKTNRNKAMDTKENPAAEVADASNTSNDDAIYKTNQAQNGISEEVGKMCDQNLTNHGLVSEDNHQISASPFVEAPRSNLQSQEPKVDTILIPAPAKKRKANEVSAVATFTASDPGDQANEIGNARRKVSADQSRLRKDSKKTLPRSLVVSAKTDSKTDRPSITKRRVEKPSFHKRTKAKSQGTERLRKYYRERLGQIGFAKWGKQPSLPAIIVDPFTVGDEARNDWKKACERARLRGSKGAKLPFLIRWYTDGAYSVIASSKFTPWPEATSEMKKFGQSEEQKLAKDKAGIENKKLTKIVEAMKEFRKDLELYYGAQLLDRASLENNCNPQKRRKSEHQLGVDNSAAVQL